MISVGSDQAAKFDGKYACKLTATKNDGAENSLAYQNFCNEFGLGTVFIQGDTYTFRKSIKNEAGVAETIEGVKLAATRDNIFIITMVCHPDSK